MLNLLIVNADDWGGFRAGTDAIQRCFHEGAITSATAMVGMADSERAAEIAGDIGLPTGLHLNLTQPVDGAGLTPAARERQRRVCAHFADVRRRRWTVDLRPSTRRLVRDSIADQFESYVGLYGREPSHVDGHHHVHVCPDVALALPSGTKVRQTLATGNLHARVKQSWLARRFRTPDRLVYFSDIGHADELRAHGAATLEVMCHPSFPDELPRLLSDDWIGALPSLPRGTYAQLN